MVSSNPCSSPISTLIPCKCLYVLKNSLISIIVCSGRSSNFWIWFHLGSLLTTEITFWSPSPSSIISKYPNTLDSIIHPGKVLDDDSTKMSSGSPSSDKVFSIKPYSQGYSTLLNKTLFSLILPVSWSISYLFLDLKGISIIASTTSFYILSIPFIILIIA